MNTFKLITGIAISASLLSACGGDKAGNANNSSGTNGINPNTLFTEKTSITRTIEGKSVAISVEAGATGSFAITDEGISLVNGIPSINIVDIQRDNAIDISCVNAMSGRATVTSDFSTGNVVQSGTVDGKSIACTSKFDVVLPATLTTPDMIEELLEDWGDDTNKNAAHRSGLISTDCPQDHSDNIYSPFESACTGSNLVNYKLTDDSGKTHKISRKFSFTVK